jgi:hypothetical protein
VSKAKNTTGIPAVAGTRQSPQTLSTGDSEAGERGDVEVKSTDVVYDVVV